MSPEAEVGLEERVDRVEQVRDVSLADARVLEAALVVVVGRPDQRLPEPGQREDRAARRRPGTIAAAFSGSRSRSIRTCVPRLGRITGMSSSSCSSSGRMRSAQTPVALTTLSARDREALARLLLLADDAGRAARPPRSAPRPARRSRTRRRSARPRRAPSAPAASRRSGSRRRDTPRSGCAAASAGISSSTSSPSIVRWRSGLQYSAPSSAASRSRAAAARAACARHHVVHVQPHADPAVAAARPRTRAPGTAAASRGAARAAPSAGARAAPRARARGRSSAGSAGRRGSSSRSGSRFRTTSRRARRARPSSRASRRRARRPRR